MKDARRVAAEALMRQEKRICELGFEKCVGAVEGIGAGKGACCGRVLRNGGTHGDH